MQKKVTLYSVGAATLLCVLALLLTSPVQARPLSGITSPSANSALAGEVSIHGTADHPEFRKWQVDLVLAGQDGHATFLALGEQPVRDDTFFVWDTTAYPDGTHTLRLRVVHSNLNYDEYYVPVTLRNGRTMTTALELSSTAPSIEKSPPRVVTTDPPQDAAVAPEGVERWIEVDISEQRLRAWEGDQTVFDYTVSTGKPGFRTLPGTFSVYRKYEETRMRGYDYDTPDVPWTMYYSGGFAIHGAYWHEDFGTPVSHGCVNLPVEEAKALYEWADMGTVVVVRP
jgi:lipoprotein-anchoring transpeptidase ErfK/SrfK